VHAALLFESFGATFLLSEDDVTPNEAAQNMAYLQAVINEDMQWHPLV